MPLVLGLGNPGARYARTRHNTGARVVERVVAKVHAEPLPEASEYRAWHARIEEQDLDLMVSRTYMNDTGAALAAWHSRQALVPEDLLVVVDDVYLPIGRLRFRGTGSTGGHQGLASVENALQSRNWARLRVGVGAAESSERLGEHVLEEFEPEELKPMERAIERAADAVVCWTTEGLARAMNRFNAEEEEVSES
ncbi:MAG TPA: aminoacyl-tRNA hydrolase [Candidatus Sulfotelmatobacter sp.]|nr:aminoacyl-tRNA hydrolase [Candidatus Sulfotelmatobacter sp.]